jgi:hypothetical protein
MDTVEAITCIKKKQTNKEYETKEFETKFSFAKNGLKREEYHRIVVSFLSDECRYFCAKVDLCSDLVSYFFVGDDTEYSVFTWEGSKLLKVKNHKIVEADNFYVFENVELFERDVNKIRETILAPHVQHIGSMRKQRIKDFVFDTFDGRFYSIATTICSVST